MKMSHELGNKEKIYQLLQKEPLTSIEIANKLETNENPKKNIQFIRIYLQRLIKANLIKSKEKKGRYQVYTAIEKGETNFDAEILKKMIPEFIKKGIEIDLDNNEIERVRELYGQI